MQSNTGCELCGGVGLLRVVTNGRSSSRPCDCQPAAAEGARIARAGIPGAFRGATFKSYRLHDANRRAAGAAWRFCEEFVPGKGHRNAGLLLTGSVGTGKTHLAVAAMRELTARLGIEARFVLIPELLERLKESYGATAAESQGRILRPIFEADLVVIDELGSARPSDWVFETIELLIGGLYNGLGTVIVTTNLPNLQAGGVAAGSNEYSRAARPETLGDRIGARMFSRLQEMTICVEMSGPDQRAKR